MKLVKCIKGYKPLIENEIYTVKKITKDGNYELYEVEPPKPYNSFNKERFIDIDINDVGIGEIHEILNNIEA
jgi:hypothetical protein